MTAYEALLLALGLTMMLGAGIFDLSLGANLLLWGTGGCRVRSSGRPPDRLLHGVADPA